MILLPLRIIYSPIWAISTVVRSKSSDNYICPNYKEIPHGQQDKLNENASPKPKKKTFGREGYSCANDSDLKGRPETNISSEVFSSNRAQRLLLCTSPHIFNQMARAHDYFWSTNQIAALSNKLVRGSPVLNFSLVTVSTGRQLIQFKESKSGSLVFRNSPKIAFTDESFGFKRWRKSSQWANFAICNNLLQVSKHCDKMFRAKAPRKEPPTQHITVSGFFWDQNKLLCVWSHCLHALYVKRDG